MMGTTGFASGCAGMALGLSGMLSTASKGDGAVPPWNDDGIRQRVDGLSHNYKVRLLDLCVWSGIGLVLGTIVWNRGTVPPRLKLSQGRLGLLQALSLGSALGGLGAIGTIFSGIS